MLGLNPQQILFLLVLFVALVLFITEWIRTDLVAVLVMLALYVTRVLKPEEALSGFSSEPAIVVAGIFVLSGALHATGLSDLMGKWIGRLAGEGLSRAIAVIMPAWIKPCCCVSSSRKGRTISTIPALTSVISAPNKVIAC